MEAPQIILSVLIGLEVYYAFDKDGKPKEGEHSASTALLAYGVIIGLLIWGGFFN